MNKPLTVAKNELESSMVELINQYQNDIPAFVVREIIRRLDAQLENIEKQQYENDRKVYLEALKEEEHKDETVEE